jgi:hypothetical protein
MTKFQIITEQIGDGFRHILGIKLIPTRYQFLLYFREIVDNLNITATCPVENMDIALLSSLSPIGILRKTAILKLEKGSFCQSLKL